MIRGLLILIFGVLTCACIGVENERLSAFIDLDSLVTAQVNTLYETKATLHKAGVVDGRESETTVVPDSMQWVRELAIFRQANLNKPRLVELYATSRETLPTGGTVTTYTSEKPGDTRVQWLRVSRGDYLSAVEAELTDSNPVYGSKILLKMNFSESSSGRIESYEITGGERLKVKDSVSYDLKARISID